MFGKLSNEVVLRPRFMCPIGLVLHLKGNTWAIRYGRSNARVIRPFARQVVEHRMSEAVTNVIEDIDVGGVTFGMDSVELKSTLAKKEDMCKLFW